MRLPSKYGGRGRPPLEHWRDALYLRQEVRNHTGSLWTVRGETHGMGRLDARYWNSVQTARYVVYSYRTPIAWIDEYDNWWTPDERYSATTTQHQDLIRGALDASPLASAGEAVQVVEHAKRAQAAARLALAEYDAVGLPVNDGPWPVPSEV